MKKRLSFLSVVLMLTMLSAALSMLVLPVGAEAENNLITENGFIYNPYLSYYDGDDDYGEGTGVIVGFSEKLSGDIIIPDTIGGYPVNGIMFTSLYQKSEEITGITIPDSVIYIEGGVFSGFSGLVNITVESENKKYYSDGNCVITTNTGKVISGCKASVIPTDGSVTSIGSYAFSGCTELTSIAIPDSITSIEEGAFSGCTELTSIAIPDSITSIEEGAFAGCTGLTDIVIPDSVLSIGNSAFVGCTGLADIVIPDSVLSIGSSAFSDCTGLTDIVIPDSVLSIGSSAFSGCTGLTNIVIPSSVTTIEEYVFRNCTSLTNITIPDSVTTIENGAFYGCTALTGITLGENNISYIKENGILYDKNKTAVIYADKDIQGDIVIPEGVTSIYDYAFYGCTGLTGVTIPSSVDSIGDSAFYGCTGIKGNLELGNKDSSDNDLVIGGSAFEGCTGIEAVNIYNARYILEYAFKDCTSLKGVNYDGNIDVYFLSGLFSGCTSLKVVDCSEVNVNTYSINNRFYEEIQALGQMSKAVVISYELYRELPNSNGIFDGCDNVVVECRYYGHMRYYAEDNNVNYKVVSTKDNWKSLAIIVVAIIAAIIVLAFAFVPHAIWMILLAGIIILFVKLKQANKLLKEAGLLIVKPKKGKKTENEEIKAEEAIQETIEHNDD